VSGLEIRSICVFASSSERVDACYRNAARELGAAIAGAGMTLVYGGASVGLMGDVAGEAKRFGGRVVGVIPEHIAERGLAFGGVDELVTTTTMRERKAEMEARSDAVVALPGGFGTLEELLEIITLKQLSRHSKPVCLLDVNRFYAPLIALFEHLYREGFARDAYRGLYERCDDVPATMSYLAAYEPVELTDKWH
jgi:cytokinin riboside 5'-monophosphate phosphoribohydrolase